MTSNPSATKGYAVRVVDGALVMETHEVTTRPSLEYMQAAVGGFIERVGFAEPFLRYGIDVWVNEEGRLQNLPVKCVLDYGHGLEPIAGDVLFLSSDKEKGECRWLTRQQAERLQVMQPKVGMAIRVGHGSVTALKPDIPIVTVKQDAL